MNLDQSLRLENFVIKFVPTLSKSANFVPNKIVDCDLTDQPADPVEVLSFGVQLGGATDINSAGAEKGTKAVIWANF